MEPVVRCQTGSSEFLPMDIISAADAGDLERVMFLVEQGVDKDNIIDANGRTPLYAASRNGHIPVVRFLVEQGAEKDKANFDGVSPLIVACYKGHSEVVHYLLAQGANKNKSTNRGNSSLHFAVRFGYLSIVELLMVYGADLDGRNDNNELPIDKTSNKEIRQVILDEPERRKQQQPRKRCIEQDRFSSTTAEVSTRQEWEQRNNLSADGEAAEGEVTDDDDESESSSEEDDH